MSAPATIAAIFLLILVLSHARSKLVLELQGISLLLFSNASPGVYLYALIVLPGTIIHELSHWIFAELLQVPTGEISILPSKGDNNETNFGYVMTAKADPFRGFIIGISPVIISIAALSLLTYYTLEVGLSALTIYLYIILGNTIATSKSDRRYLPFILVLFLITYSIFVKADLSLSPRFINHVQAGLNAAFQGLLMALSISMGAAAILMTLRFSLESLTKTHVKS